MTSTRTRSIAGVFGQRKMAVLLLLGFSSGLPLYLTSQTLQAWLTVEGIELKTIGRVSLLALPYSLKFLLAPFMDRYVPPFLGRRRGWLLVTQALLLLTIGAMAFQDPHAEITLLGVATRPIFLNALLIALFSAAHDIVVDAYRVDALAEREMGAGAALHVMGYRVALIITGGLALILADRFPWPTVYAVMAGMMAIGVLATLLAPEPVLREGPPQTLGNAVVDPFVEFFRRAGAPIALTLLAFIVLYSLADRLVQNMSTPFLLASGYTQSEVGAVRGVIGLGATIVGVLAGGVVVARAGINRSLWLFAVLQVLSNLAYYWLAMVPRDLTRLTTAVVLENFCGGLVTAGFVAFLMSLCSKQFSATQYALLSSLMAFGRDVLVKDAGAWAAATGWPRFFLLSVAAGLPALLMLPVVAPWNRDAPRGAAPHTGEVVEEGVHA